MDICIAFTPMPANQNPNVITRNNHDSVKTYYEMIIFSFLSLRMFNKTANLVLITTSYPPTNYRAELKEIGVKIKIVPFAHRPPSNYAKKFIGCFYLLDAIISQKSTDSLFLDPDIVCINPIASVEEGLSAIGAYPLEFRVGENLNGLTYEESLNTANEYFGSKGRRVNAYQFFGGEYYVIPKSSHPSLMELIDELYAFSLKRFHIGETFFPTEEHLLSAALSQFKVVEQSGEIKRIWTARKYRNIDGSEKSLSLLHFPSEKEFGFQKAYRAIHKTKKSDRLKDPILFQNYIYQVFQVNKKSRLRLLEIIVKKLKNKIIIR